MSIDIKKVLRLFVAESLLAFLCFAGVFPPLTGLPLQSCALFFVFVSTIIFVVCGGVGMGVATFMAIAVLTFFKILPFNEATSGFSHGTPWLVFCAFCFCRAFNKSGLGHYLAIFLQRRSKGSMQSFLYHVVALDFMAAPFVPSNAARAGSASIPVLTNILAFLKDRKTPDSVGAYLVLVTFLGTLAASSLFLTGTAPNLLSLSLAKSIAGVHVSWLSWFLYMFVPIILLVFCIFLFVPRILGVNKAALPAINLPKMKQEKLSSEAHKLMLVFSGVLFLWIFGDNWNISAVQAGFFGVAVLLLCGVLSWKDIISNQGAWDNLFWYGTFVSMASALGSHHVFFNIGGMLNVCLDGLSPEIIYMVGSFIFFFAHYMFAGIGPYVVSFFPIFLTLFLDKGVPPLVATVSLGGCATLSAMLTHYGSTLTPLFWGLNTVTVKVWWRVGLCLGVLCYIITTIYGLCVWRWLT